MFSKRLKELREEKCLSQSELAKMIKVSSACINRWEKDLRVPSIESAKSLCKIFDVSADYLIGLSDDY